MAERPLILFGNPSIAEKERRFGGASKYGMPNHKRQVDRLGVQFTALQNNIIRAALSLKVMQQILSRNTRLFLKRLEIHKISLPQ